MVARFLVILLFLITPAFAQDAQTEDTFVGDARGLVWGLSQDDIKRYEQSEFLGPFENALSYKGQDFGKDAFITYYFFDNKLGRIIVEYDYLRANPQDYLNDYIEFQSQLTELYGDPSSDDIVWRNDIYRNDPERWGIGVMMGGVQFSSLWSTPTSIIRMTLRGDKMKAELETTYVSKTVLQRENAVSLTPQNAASE
ncbi:MAG: hypothetical protein AAF569_00785 [Pseudomonadota bacterium]